MRFTLSATALGLLAAFVSGVSCEEDNYRRTLNIVAHQDDDLLFLNPEIINDISIGRGVRTVFLTAGDAGLGSEYWTGRQNGTMAAYASMAGVDDDWDESDLDIPDGDICLYTLKDQDDISLIFLHLPDGGADGDGFPSTGNESMEKLWKRAISAIGTVDESDAVYTRDSLVDTLTWIINDYNPHALNAQNYLDDFCTGDHSDHTAGALFANEAAKQSCFEGVVTAYFGFESSAFQRNVLGEDLEAKKSAFYQYAEFDSAACSSDRECAGTVYEPWLQREWPRN
jgi:LmbE family N-acetylglucosaminyl deacetylase